MATRKYTVKAQEYFNETFREVVPEEEHRQNIFEAIEFVLSRDPTIGRFIEHNGFGDVFAMTAERTAFSPALAVYYCRIPPDRVLLIEVRVRDK
jgi:hypothetical protein